MTARPLYLHGAVAGDCYGGRLYTECTPYTIIYMCVYMWVNEAGGGAHCDVFTIPYKAAVAAHRGKKRRTPPRATRPRRASLSPFLTRANGAGRAADCRTYYTGATARARTGGPSGP